MNVSMHDACHAVFDVRIAVAAVDVAATVVIVVSFAHVVAGQMNICKQKHRANPLNASKKVFSCIDIKPTVTRLMHLILLSVFA